MATRWERLAGDTSVFALRVAFSSDPDEGRGVEPETSLSWGSFQIWVEGRNLCAHLEEGERIDSVHWYLLPIIEWFARNWNPLLHEERLPVRNDGDTAWTSLRATKFPPPAIENDEEKASEWEAAWQNWWARHAIRSASEGGLFPDIILRRVRDSVEVSWGPAPGEGTALSLQLSGVGEGCDQVAAASGRRTPARGDVERKRVSLVAQPGCTIGSRRCVRIFKLCSLKLVPALGSCGSPVWEWTRTPCVPDGSE